MQHLQKKYKSSILYGWSQDVCKGDDDLEGLQQTLKKFNGDIGILFGLGNALKQLLKT